MVEREDLYMPKRGIELSEDWKPRLPDVQNTRRGKEGGTSNALACQDGHLTKESGKTLKVEDFA